MRHITTELWTLEHVRVDHYTHSDENIEETQDIYAICDPEAAELYYGGGVGRLEADVAAQLGCLDCEVRCGVESDTIYVRTLNF